MFETVQAWLIWLSTFWWVKGIGMIAIFWLFMQILSNDWAGGYLFERRGLWITSTIAAVVILVVFVVPWVTWQLLLGIVAVAVLVAFAFWAKTNIK